MLKVFARGNDLRRKLNAVISAFIDSYLISRLLYQKLLLLRITAKLSL